MFHLCPNKQTKSYWSTFVSNSQSLTYELICHIWAVHLSHKSESVIIWLIKNKYIAKKCCLEIIYLTRIVILFVLGRGNSKFESSPESIEAILPRWNVFWEFS
jgi:hypothetical protein